jgi:ABC transport system ATP-binding/permease protein
VYVPILVIGQLFMLGVLRLTSRMPASGWDIYGQLILTLVLTAFSGLALSLVASAAVSSPDQASQVAPLLIIPQTLFSGAILAVPAMNVVGKAISYGVIGRWSWEALGHSVDMNGLWANNTSQSGQLIGQGLLQQYGDTFSRDVVQNWLFLSAFILAFLVVTCLILKRKSTRS